MTRVSLNALVEAYEFASWDSGAQAAYVDRRTGEIYWRAPEIDLDEVPGDVDDSARYAAVPDKMDLDLGRRVVLAFAAEEIPDLYERVQSIFRSRGAYARFKDLLAHHEKLESWYEYEAKCVERALREWCDDEGFELTTEPAPGELAPPPRSSSDD